MKKDQNKQPFFSIIMPAYNVEKYIERSLDSCQTQTFQDFEIVIVDDCSNDNSIKKAEHRQKTDKRIKIIKNQKNLGTYHARRIGIDSSSGKYILFLDPDDELRKDALHLINKKINEKPVDILFYGVKIEPSQRKKHTALPKESNSRKELLENCFLKNKEINFGIAGKAYCRSIIINTHSETRIADEERICFGEDCLMFFIAASNSTISSSLNEEIYIYHKNQDSITKSTNKQKIKENSRQINIVISQLYHLLANKKDLDITSERSCKEVINRLLLDQARISRMLRDENGEVLYAYQLREMIRAKMRTADIIRGALYLLSAGIIKL